MAVRRWVRIGLALVMLLSLLSTTVASADSGAQARVIPPDQSVLETDKTYGELSAEFWQWVASIPSKANPLLDSSGADCAVGQSGQVFFLAGSWVGPVTRDCHVSSGHYLFFPLVNMVAFRTDPTDTVASLRAGIVAGIGKAHDLYASVDDGSIITGNQFRAKSPPFSITFPRKGVFTAGTYEPAVADGYYLLLAPLPPGEYTIAFGGITGDGFEQDITYHLVVSQ